MLRKFYALLAAFTLFTAVSVAQVVSIPDPNLERVIRKELDIQHPTPLFQEDMLNLTHLGWNDENIVDLTGIESAVNITFLILGGNPIQDLSPIGSLPKLEVLHIAGVYTKDLDWIADTTSLKDLFAIHCGVEDISGLAKLTNLVSLDLAVNRIVDISALSNLVNLERLHIEGNSIEDVSPLSGLAALRELHIFDNLIFDFDPISGLVLDEFQYDQECEVPKIESIGSRIENRSLPSNFLPWSSGLGNWTGNWSLDTPFRDRVSVYDLWWRGEGAQFELDFILADDGYRIVGDMPKALEIRGELKSKNPNMLFLVDLRQRYADVDRFPEDWFGWVRDKDGSLVPVNPNDPNSQKLINYRLPEVQDVIVDRARAISRCGLFDGIMFDAWGHDDSIPRSERYALLGKIRDNVPDDFLILFNTNHWYIPDLATHINGAFMETFPNVREDGYTRGRIVEIEKNLISYENNVREPKINCLRGFGIGSEQPDSLNNRRWMRLFTTMSLTCSDGYVIYTLGDVGGQSQFQEHIRHPFWEVDLGQPISQTVQKHDEIEGLYIREFTNGWAVYNRSGSAHAVELPEKVRSVQSGIENDSQVVLDLDGDIFLRIKIDPADVNGDGIVNILDLLIVAQSIGTGENDVNGDGVTNVFDLVIVAEAIQ